MSNINIIKLDGKAVEYVEEQLLLGNTLARYILKEQDLKNGNVITFLPSGTNQNELMNFKEGILKEPSERILLKNSSVMVPKPNMDNELTQIIEDYLKNKKNSICIFEDALLRPKDPVVSKIDTDILIINEEIYHFVSGNNINREKIKKTVRRASSWLFIAILVSCLHEISVLHKNGPIKQSDLLILAKRVDKIIIGAYDGEGYLIWEK